MKCTKCGDIVATVAAVLACRTCSEDGTANECRGYEELDSAVALKPQLANRFVQDKTAAAAEHQEELVHGGVAGGGMSEPVRTPEEQAAFDESNRLVEQRRIAEAEAFAKAQAAYATGTGESVLGAGAPAAEAGQADQAAVLNSPDAGST